MIFASVMYSSYEEQRISRRWTRSGTNLVFFLESLCAQTNLFWRQIKINNMYTEI